MMELRGLNPQEFRTGDKEPGKNALGVRRNELSPTVEEGQDLQVWV